MHQLLPCFLLYTFKHTNNYITTINNSDATSSLGVTFTVVLPELKLLPYDDFMIKGHKKGVNRKCQFLLLVNTVKMSI